MDSYFGGDSHEGGKVIHSLISDLPEDSIILKLLNEIAMVIQLPLTPYLCGPHSMVIHYLEDYRARRAISRRSIDAVPFPKELLLTRKISKLHETEIYTLCHEIAMLRGSGVEQVAGHTLYVFLDQYLKKRKTKPPVPPGYAFP